MVEIAEEKGEVKTIEEPIEEETEPAALEFPQPVLETGEGAEPPSDSPSHPEKSESQKMTSTAIGKE